MNQTTPRPATYGLDPYFSPHRIVLIHTTPASAADPIWQNLTALIPAERLTRIALPPSTSTSEPPQIPTDQIPDHCDLAIIIAPIPQQLAIACACDTRHVRTALLMTPDSHEPQPHEIPWAPHTPSRQCPNGLRILGPQSFGLICPRSRLNITPGHPMPQSGKTAFLSQSGAMAASVLHWSLETNIGFSAMVACEIMTDVEWADLITHFGDDPFTRTIVIYIETIGNARTFLSAAREVALSKPIILLKPGVRSTPKLPTEDQLNQEAALNAALQRVGVLRVKTIAELFFMANILASHPVPRGPNLTILTNSHAPALLATDTLHASGGKLTQFTPETTQAINTRLNHSTPIQNPINLTANATPQQYETILRSLITEPDSHGLLVIHMPHPNTQPIPTAQAIIHATKNSHKPILVGWMGFHSDDTAMQQLVHAGIPTFPYPDTPARLFALMWQHAQNLNSIYETPTVIIDEATVPVDITSASLLLHDLHTRAITELTPEQAATTLRHYGIRVTPGATTSRHDIELSIGSRIDPLFGPVIYFGSILTGAQQISDTALDLPPLTSALAMRLMEQSRAWALMKTLNREAFPERLNRLQALLVRLSQLIIQQNHINTLKLDIVIPADNRPIQIPSATITLHHPDTQDHPRPAIRPYPVQYTWHEKIRNGSTVLIRPIRPEDEPLIIEFHRTLSEETIYRRYFFHHKFSRRTSHERLRRTCFLDFDREIALATVLDTPDGPAIIGVGRISRNRSGETGEIALVVSDHHQSQGIGTHLLTHLLDIARTEGLQKVEGTMLPGNIHMQHLFGKLGFNIRPGADDTVIAELYLPTPPQ